MTLLWIPLEVLSNPNIPAFSLSNLAPGMYQFTLTALDTVNNESVPSERFGLAIQLEIPLVVGQNIIGYPIKPSLNYTSEGLLSDLGISTKSLIHYVPEAFHYQMSYWEENTVQGIFSIIQDEGYIMYQNEAGCLHFTGTIEDKEISLYPGKNLIGLPLLSSDERLFDVLYGLRETGEPVTSVYSYQPQAGKWIGQYDFFGKISGPCTTINRGFGCLVYSK